MDYNLKNKDKLDIVFFKDNIEHLSRVVRILTQPRGHVIMIGVGGR